MRRIAGLMIAVLFLMCSLTAVTVQAAEKAQAGSALLDGTMWKASTEAEKLAFLLGVEATVAMEQSLYAEAKEAIAAGQSVKYAPDQLISPFCRAWLGAFDGKVSRPELSQKLDDYLEKHPEAMKRHIFDIIWYEFVMPQAGQHGGKS